MPELPEVQTVVSDLQELIVGQKLIKITVNDPKVWFRSEFAPSDYEGRILQRVSRRGKYIIYDFTDKYLVQHLRMTGKMLPLNSEKIPHNIIEAKSPQLRLQMDFERDSLVFWDSRRFGTFTAIANLDSYLRSKRLAPEIYEDELMAQECYVRKAKTLSRPVKSVLLDQSVICGPGNIYADEALFRSKINPQTPSTQLTRPQHELLFIHAKEVMDEAIAKRGTSAHDYLDVNGNPGVFKEYLRVYRRAGEPCLVCQSTVVKVKIGGRSSHFCPSCQPLNQPDAQL